MCTSLLYTDAAGRAYYGRTLELSLDLPYRVLFLPAGTDIHSEIAGYAPVDYRTRYGLLGVAMPRRVPTAEAPATLDDLKVLEGLNEKGLTFSLLSYPQADGPQAEMAAATAVLSATDLGSWALGQFATVAEVKAALAAQPIRMEPLAILGGLVSPFHYVVHDAGGASLVFEFHHGRMSVHENPVGVMTNAPQFDWHLTNLANYSFLSNVDQSRGVLNGFAVMQPGSGIATAGLPASNTSPDRFIRAVYYSAFAEKAADPDGAVRMLAHVMNNFDRPRGITIDPPDTGSSHLAVQGANPGLEGKVPTEFTSWTSLADLDRRRLYLRDHRALAYVGFDLAALAGAGQPMILPFSGLDTPILDATATLKAHAVA